jgi:predicted transcriptional regulator YdeE
VAKVLPPGDYARFTLRGEEISADWPLAVSAWLEEHGYRSRTSFSYELYDERFKGIDRIAESVIEVHVPLVR